MNNEEKLQAYFDLLQRLINNLNELNIKGDFDEESNIKKTLKSLCDILCSEVTFIARYDSKNNMLITFQSYPESFKLPEQIKDININSWGLICDQDEVFSAENDSMESSFLNIGINSLIAVPFHYNNDNYIIACCNKKVMGPYEYTIYGSDEGKILLNIANLLSENIIRENKLKENERAIKYDLKQAANVQRQLLPLDFPKVEGYDIGYNSIPARTVGGDYCDFVPLSGNELLIIIGDVAGKGISAALILVIVRSFLHFYLEKNNNKIDIQQCLFELNNIIYNSFKTLSNRTYVTLIIGKLNLEDHSLKYINAGHLPPIIIKKDKMTPKIIDLTHSHFAVGMWENTLYQTHKIIIEEEDIIALYTDGITEAMKGEELFEICRLKDVLLESINLSSKEIIKKTLEAVNNFCQSQELQDDTSLIVIRRN